MRIAYLIPQLGDRGMTRIPLYLAKKFNRDKHEVKIFYFGKDYLKAKQDKDSILDFDGIPIKNIKLNNFYEELNTFDIVHSHGLKPDLYAFFNSKKIKPLKISTIHNYDRIVLRYDKGFIYGALFGILWDFTRKKLDMSVCLTQTMENFYRKLGYQKTTIIANGIETPIVNEISRNNLQKFDPSQRINLSTVSALVNWKGVDQVIKMLNLNPQCYFTAVGGNVQSIESLQKLASDLNVADRCFFVGHQSNPWDIAIQSHLFIFPSRFEGLPLALLEAASLGMPIICSDIAIFRDIFDDSEVTFFELDNIDDLSQKITNLDFDVLRLKAEKAKLKVEDVFSIDNMYSNYCNLYKDLLCK